MLPPTCHMSMRSTVPQENLVRSKLCAPLPQPSYDHWDFSHEGSANISASSLIDGLLTLQECAQDLAPCLQKWMTGDHLEEPL